MNRGDDPHGDDLQRTLAEMAQVHRAIE